MPGHEITGVVAETGTDVTRHAVGDRVGVGCMIDSCRTCTHCRRGLEQYCLGKNVGTYNDVDRFGLPTQGGYSTEIVVDEHFVLRIPDGLALDVAAPLLCAGITTYSPLKRWNAGPGTRVAILGFGGLGHVGVKIAAALGAEVSVLSQTLAKQKDGLAFGAAHFYATEDASTLDELASTFDLIINTVSAALPMDRYLSLLALDGTLVNVGAPPVPLQLSVNTLMGARRSWAGSGIGGILETQAMLDFCAAHGVGAEIETIAASYIDAAWDRVVSSDVRYRFVVDGSTF